MIRRLAVLLLAPFIPVFLAAPASAHPLGNFSVNHYHGLRLYPDRVEDLAVLDIAEIPTRQEASTVDTNGDGTASAAELSQYATTTCAAVAAALHTTVDGDRLTWLITAGRAGYVTGAANLDTTRIECRLTAAVDLGHEATIVVTDRYLDDRVGWCELTATGDGIALDQSDVPAVSVSDELRHYPDDLLASPRQQRTATLHTQPGDSVLPTVPSLAAPGLVGRALNEMTRRFHDVVGAERLTVLVGLLGVGLALLLGAAHAALPGHGKTVMAAYIAGRRGTVRDAVVVGATVTVTHTAGVLGLGLALTLLIGLVGEVVLGWLGVLSGLLVAVIGLRLLMSARRPATPVAATALVAAGPALHHHHHHDHHDHRHHDDHHHDHGHPHGRSGLVGMGIAGGLVPSPSALIVLLGAIALGRTWFGVLLVIAYGLGMAATLTAAGLALVALSRRFASARWGAWSAGWNRRAPLVTAALVLVVGLGLAVRAALPLVSLVS